MTSKHQIESRDLSSIKEEGKVMQKTHTCTVCNRKGLRGKHPCRLGSGCSCWKGIPCNGGK